MACTGHFHKKNKQKKAEEIQDDLFSFQQGTFTWMCLQLPFSHLDKYLNSASWEEWWGWSNSIKNNTRKLSVPQQKVQETQSKIMLIFVKLWCENLIVDRFVFVLFRIVSITWCWKTINTSDDRRSWTLSEATRTCYGQTTNPSQISHPTDRLLDIKRRSFSQNINIPYGKNNPSDVTPLK